VLVSSARSHGWIEREVSRAAGKLGRKRQSASGGGRGQRDDAVERAASSGRSYKGGKHACTIKTGGS
jgi:hypothetical protein